jgi:Ca2+-binding RTX toxin-like protein
MQQKVSLTIKIIKNIEKIRNHITITLLVVLLTSPFTGLVTVWADNFFGTSGPDTIVDTDNNDKIVGLKGNDNLRGEGGDDYIKGNAGNDEISDGVGNDNIRAGSGEIE